MLKVKSWKNIYHAMAYKKSWSGVLIDEIDIQTKMLLYIKRIFIMIKGIKINT